MSDLPLEALEPGCVKLTALSPQPNLTWAFIQFFILTTQAVCEQKHECVCSMSLEVPHEEDAELARAKSPRGMGSYHLLWALGITLGIPSQACASPVPPRVVLTGSWGPCLELLSCSCLLWGDTGSFIQPDGFTQAPSIWQGKGGLAFPLVLRPGQHGH